MAADVDTLFYALLALCFVVALVITTLMICFAVIYRRGSPADRSRDEIHHAKAARRNRIIELTWIFAPLAIFIALFFWGASLYASMFAVPADAIQISIVAKQWMWKAQHASGQREIDELHVPVGQAVQLIMTSEDVIHSFFVPVFRIKRDVLPGRYTTIWFKPTRTGEFHLFCAEYCGTSHAKMGGRVVVMAPAQYAEWLARGNNVGMTAQGAERFRQYGCSGCHGENATVRAPKLGGIFGKPVPVKGGGTVVADEVYIRDSILLPLKDIAAGYEPIMPSFAGRIGEDEIMQIIAYLKSLPAER